MDEPSIDELIAEFERHASEADAGGYIYAEFEVDVAAMRALIASWRERGEALKPFSDAHFYYNDAGKPDDLPTGIGSVTYGDFRRAVSVLANDEIARAALKGAAMTPSDYEMIEQGYDPPRVTHPQKLAEMDALLTEAYHSEAKAKDENRRLREALTEADRLLKWADRNGFFPGEAEPILESIAALAAEPASGEAERPVICIGEPTIAKLRNREVVELSNAILIHASDLAPPPPASGEETLRRCTHCGFIIDTKYKAEFPK
jgi:hypothetical protein